MEDVMGVVTEDVMGGPAAPAERLRPANSQEVHNPVITSPHNNNIIITSNTHTHTSTVCPTGQEWAWQWAELPTSSGATQKKKKKEEETLSSSSH